MMRITRIAGDGQGTSLRVEGRLSGRDVEELRAECAAVRSEHGSFDLDLAGLQFADPDGVKLLLDLERGGIRLTAPSGLVGELLGAGEGALVARLRAGDHGAFDTVVRQYGGRMLATARRIVASDGDAADVVQEAFVAAFRSVGSFEGHARLSTWLHRIVVNAALMKLRARRRRPEEPIDELLPRFDADGHFAQAVAAWDGDGGVQLERKETRALVRRAIDRLPEQYRTVLVLRDIEELDTEETAARLGLGSNTVKTRLHRARQALRRLLEADFGRRAGRDGGRAAAARAGARVA
jgi:RNA polymerase sigma-70 factor (ECF subfamily)